MNFSVGWHPVALRNGIEPGRSAGTRLFDKEICIWRDSEGAAHAWEDRCPHRGMRLSFGFVRGNHITCLYHGWQYDAQGRCRFIPAHPALDVPASICVATYPCIERLGMVWVYSDRTIATPIDLAIEDRDVTPVRSLYVDCAPEAAMQALAGRSKDFGPSGIGVLSIDAEGAELHAGLHPFGEVKTALHIVLAGAAESHHAATRRAAAIWAEQLRSELERGSISVVGPKASHEIAL